MSIAKLFKIYQRPRESIDSYIYKFKNVHKNAKYFGLNVSLSNWPEAVYSLSLERSFRAWSFEISLSLL